MTELPDAAFPSPLRYEASFEIPEKDEADTINALIDTFRDIQKTTLENYGHAVRSVHAKSHGLLRGELHVLDGLPPALAQGLFAKPGTYPVVLRLSTTPGDLLDDDVSTPRGMAVKVLGVEGTRLPGSEDDATQDFVLVNGPAFLKRDLKSFLKSLKLLAATTDKAEGLKKAASSLLQTAEKAIERVGSESANLKSMGGHPETHILGETFYSQAALLYGPYMAKVAVVPVAAQLTALTGAPLNLDGKPDGLRQAVMQYFATQGAQWEVRVQLCTDRETMPIEDASVVWPEDRSPYVTVARIEAPSQQAWSEARSAAIDDGLSFSPWHGLAAHRPLGAIMRARQAAYEMSARFRGRYNKRPIQEPRTIDDLPD